MFWKKKKMIDVRNIKGRGVIIRPMPENKTYPATDSEGFVQIGKKTNYAGSSLSNSSNSSGSESSSNTSDFLNFMNNPSSTSFSDSPQSLNSSSSDDLRKISKQISDLDNKLYKLEQRIELLERKTGVTSANNSSPIGW